MKTDVFRSGFVSIVGRTNAGKSTLVNRLVGQKVAIVSDKPQTTRYRIMGVLNRENLQIVFTDTPGIHDPKTRLGDFMISQANEALVDTDAVVLVIEPVENIGKAEEKLLKSLKKIGAPVILAINKIDTIKKEKLFGIIELYSKEFEFDAVVPLCAKNGNGVDILLSEIEKHIGEGYKFFPDDMVTDSPERQRIAEAVREKILRVLSHEVPHGIAVEISSLKLPDDPEKTGRTDITIYCEKDSHKGIIIGKGGEQLKKIASLARPDIERILGRKMYMEIWVKVKEGWRDNNYLLKNFGFE